MAEITVKGLDEVLSKLNLIGPDLHKALRPAVKDALEIVRGRMREYPPPPPASRYARTGNLGASWEIFPQEGGGDVLGVVRSYGVPYNRYVQSADNQAEVHRGRWQTDEDVAAEKEDEVTAVIADFIEALLK